ncbi:hypothetical protein LWI28_016513 [Acer negundo]|uniref:Uncharacterized protein n=1 Tax=Acer negundo TaxID=4023 RepID=A0AAD5J563_ACENE|nr:hypothetical protein LWI28_016513 [Acer negundo]
MILSSLLLIETEEQELIKQVKSSQNHHLLDPLPVCLDIKTTKTKPNLCLSSPKINHREIKPCKPRRLTRTQSPSPPNRIHSQEPTSNPRRNHQICSNQRRSKKREKEETEREAGEKNEKPIAGGQATVDHGDSVSLYVYRCRREVQGLQRAARSKPPAVTQTQRWIRFLNLKRTGFYQKHGYFRSILG